VTKLNSAQKEKVTCLTDLMKVRVKNIHYLVYIAKCYLVVYVQRTERGNMKREESVALLKELGTNQLVRPIAVSIEHKLPDSYQLKIRGDYDLQAMKILLKNRFSVEENQDYLVISTPDQ